MYMNCTSVLLTVAERKLAAGRVLSARRLFEKVASQNERPRERDAALSQLRSLNR